MIVVWWLSGFCRYDLFGAGFEFVKFDNSVAI